MPGVPGGRRTCRRCGCNTWTSRGGSGRGSTATCCGTWCPAGATGSPGRRCGNCPPTGPGRTGRPSAAACAASTWEPPRRGPSPPPPRPLGVTPFGVLLGAYALTLAAHAGGDAGVIGVPLAGRGRPELDGVVGPCSNTLPLRVDLAGDPTLAEVTARANEAMLAAVSGQDVPFGKLAEALLPDRDASRNPLFDVLFNLGNLPPGSDRAELGPDTTMRIDGCPNGTVRLDLELTVEHGPDALTGRLEYNAELFDDATAETLIEDLRHVLDQIAGHPEERRSAVRPPGAARRRVAARARALRDDGAPAARPASASRRSRGWSR
nr:hypothetical protein GCM10020092_040140 [Actinoplanes digitatis]